MTKFASVSYLRDANKAITCEKHPTPTMEELHNSPRAQWCEDI